MPAHMKWQKVASAVVASIGLVLMTIKIYADSEPGLIPLVLVAGGITWHLVTRARIRRAREPELR